MCAPEEKRFLAAPNQKLVLQSPFSAPRSRENTCQHGVAELGCHS